MAARDDAAALLAHGGATSDASRADQSLCAPATATASGDSGSAEEPTSGVLKLAAGDSSAGGKVAGCSAAEPNQAAASSRGTHGILLEPTAEELALRLELAHVRHTLEQDDHQLDGASVGGDAPAEAVEDGNPDTIEFRVIPLGRGTYRGQARLRGQLEQNEWEPHGLGVLTTATGSTCCGNWLHGTQVGHGTSYDTTLHYEGAISAGYSATASHLGVGLYIFGALFAGCWVPAPDTPQASTPRPQGLGSLQSSVQIDSANAVDGWFHGLRCIHQCQSEMDIRSFKLSSNVRQLQPLRGLLVADEKLQFWRRCALTRALNTWTRLCCENNTARSKQSRLLALTTQQEARRAEQRAIRDDLDRQEVAKSQDATELLALLAKSREAQDQRSQRRQLYAQRLAGAIKQRDLARACVAKQQSAIQSLEFELQEIMDLLQEARQAQASCAQYARELHVIKRQIENASVKLNAARAEAQRNEVAWKGPQQEQPTLSARSVPPTPVKTSRNDVDNDVALETRGESTQRSAALDQQFVCDVPGCLCGIPRDVFLRVAAAMNDDS
ncbi:unnamed protein product [Phytophthora lilii]|uniref:Unnamed protein product n=1 Tax=Phytophthora lilii TaxID=2077276 RepID=A0A9W6WH89_9STRA|nr:unnamed protein product [Phytophthora lilii]